MDNTGEMVTAPASSAGQFRDSVGVGATPSWLDTAYGDWDRVLARLRELGVNHIRTELLTSPNEGWMGTIYGRLNAAIRQGVRLNLLVPHTCSPSGSMDPCLQALKSRLPRAGVESVEWPNEYDQYGGPNWISALTSWGRQLHQKMKADPALRSIKVLGPSLVHPASRDNLGDQSAWLDRGNIHPYTGATSPNPMHMLSERALAAKVAGGKPLVATEAGFHTSYAYANGGHPPADEATAAVYTVRTVLEHYESGVERTYIHQLLNWRNEPNDPDSNFGLLRHDFSPKPAFTALRNLLAMVGTSGPATTTPLPHALSGDTSDLRRLVLQKADGSHLLILWRFASIYDRDARQPIAVAPKRYAVALPGATSVEAGNPLAGTGFLPVALEGGRVVQDVGRDPVVLHVRRAGAGAGAGVAPPAAGVPATSPGAGQAAALDTRRPRLTRVRVKRVGRRWVAVFRLSEAARVGVRLERGRAGSRKRYRFLRRLATRPVRAGARSVTLGRKLRRGRHRVLLSAVDAAGNRAQVVVRFRVRASRGR